MSSLKLSILQNQNQSAIEALKDCVQACNACLRADLGEQEIKMMVRCIELDIDCAAFCSLTLEYLSRDSELAIQVAKECALICDVCAEECEKHTHMLHCVECAKVCRKCAQECRNLQSRPH
jgi:hypothetical protein